MPHSPPRAGGAATPWHRFVVRADRCPQLLCRLLGLFAQQDRMIDAVDARTTPRRLVVTLWVAGMDDHRAEIVAAKMRQMIAVRDVAVHG